MTTHKISELEKSLVAILLTVVGGVCSVTCYKANIVIEKVDALCVHEKEQDGKLEYHNERFSWIDKEIDELKSRISSNGRAIVQSLQKTQ
jgi:hypothetical protein